MIQAMKKKPADNAGAREGNAATTHVRLRTAYHVALQELARRNRRTLTGELEIALERHLTAEGVWPLGEGDAE